MAPTRKKSVSKRFLYEVTPDKEVKKANKNKQSTTGKKKLSDKLGPQWSKGELQRFYRAYRAYGEDWTMVAAEVRHRSVDMVEALYNMNRAYLSLPEGTASVVGLIAMMTDHYNVLEASESERESSEVPGTVRKLQKRKQAKVQLSASKDLHQPLSVALTDGCLSLLKRARIDGGQPRVVGKRTPRFPISYAHTKDDRGCYSSPKIKNRNLLFDSNDDEVAHVAALALTEALQKGGSPEVCQTPHRRMACTKSSPVQSWNGMSESAQAKLHDGSINWLEGGIRNRGSDANSYGKGTSSSVNVEGVGTVEVHQKGNKFYQKKVKIEEFGNCQSDDGGEAFSGTDEGQRSITLKDKLDVEVANTKVDETSMGARRKGSKKLVYGGEFSALNPLHTLAHIFVMDSESSVQLNEEGTLHDVDEKCSIPEAISTSHQRDRVELVRQGENIRYSTTGAEGTTSRKSKLGKHSESYTESFSEAKQKPQPINNIKSKRKHQFFVSMLQSSNAEAAVDFCQNNPSGSESLGEEDQISFVKSKCINQISASSKHSNLIGGSEGSCFSGDQKSAASLAVSTAQVPVVSQTVSAIRQRSRRKMNLKRVLSSKEGQSSGNMKNQANKYAISLNGGSLQLKDMLSGCLSSSMVRRWCTFEWFYSAIDYPWFAKREFEEYLNHVGLGHIPRLTRVERGVVRSSLGKPRRFSERFLYEEREKLQQYRQSVRKHYTELRTGVREGLPTDLARPLSVGQQVIAIHPKTGELHDGSVLTVDHDRCRVQFDRPEIGVEFIKDIDCMPLNPLDNMPEALRRNRIFVISKELQVPGHSNTGVSSSEHLQNVLSPMDTLIKPAQVDKNHAVPQAKVPTIDILNTSLAACSPPSAVAQIQAKKSDIQALSELNFSLDNKKASSPLLNVKQHNSYPGSSLPPWLNPPSNSIFTGGLLSSRDGSSVSQEPGSTVVKIVNGSRSKAHTMVNAAVEAISSLKDGEDAFVRIGEALDSMDKRQSELDSRLPVIRSMEQVNGSLHQHDKLITSTSDPQCGADASGAGLHDDSDKIESAIPSELISSCVATLLMIKTCTERLYPPADVAQIIDSAVSSLQPCCPQNLPIYREIQTCMGRIKTQILALIRT